jgi:hypothetical protein
MRSLQAVLGVAALMIVVCTCAGARAQCDAPKTWFPHESTLEPDFHAPQSDCDFHRWAWQTFLWLTQPTGKDRIRLLDLPTAEELFLPGRGPVTLNQAAKERLQSQPLVLAPRTVKRHAPTRFDDIRQAGLRGILVDQKGRAVYYAVHVSPTYYQFVRTNRLFLRDNYIKAGPQCNFPVRSFAVKSSWRILGTGEEAKGSFTTYALVYQLACEHGAAHCKGEDIVVDRDRTRAQYARVALVGMHIAGVVEDHPEFIWSTFEHQDNAPDLPDMTNPYGADPVSKRPWTFCQANALVKNCNLANATTVTLDVARQQLSPVTNVYRQYANGGGDDDDRKNITSLNQSVHTCLQAGSVWKNYNLVGSVWFARGDLEPDLEGPSIQRRTAGSVRLSNSSMETFTQLGRRNCFACHDTGARQDLGLPPMNMNLSHVLIDGLLHRRQLARTHVKPLRLKEGQQLNSYAAVQALLNDFVKSNHVPIGSAPYGAFWDKMGYKEFTTGNIPGISDAAGKPLKVLVNRNSRESNLIRALRGTRGSIFDPVEGAVGRLPPTGPFMHEDDINLIADWIDRGCPNKP